MSRLERTVMDLVEASKNGKPEGLKRQAIAETTDSLVVVNEAEGPTPK